MLLDASGVAVAALVLVELHCLLPHFAGWFVFAECDVRVAEIFERLGSVVVVTECTEQGEGLLKVVDGVSVVAAEAGDVAEAVQCECFTVGVVV